MGAGGDETPIRPVRPRVFSLLAAAALERGPAAEHVPADAPAASRAGLARAVVHGPAFQGGLVGRWGRSLAGAASEVEQAVGTALEVDRERAPEPDGKAKDLADGVVQAGDLGRIQAFRGPCGPDGGVVKGLVGVDVADPGEHRLVEQAGLHGLARPREGGCKDMSGEGIVHGLGPEPLDGAKADPSELAGVHEHPAPPTHAKDDGGMAVEGEPGVLDEDAAGHPEVGMHPCLRSVAGAKWEDEMLAPAQHCREDGPAKGVVQLGFRPWARDTCLENPGRINPEPGQDVVQATAQHLDLWQFRHGRPLRARGGGSSGGGRLRKRFRRGGACLPWGAGILVWTRTSATRPRRCYCRNTRKNRCGRVNTSGSSTARGLVTGDSVRAVVERGVHHAQSSGHVEAPSVWPGLGAVAVP